MPLSRKIKITSAIASIGLLIFMLIYFFQNQRNQDLKNLKKDFTAKIEQAEEQQDVQLDSAQSFAKEAYGLVSEEPSLGFEKNKAILTLSEIEFLRLGASDERYKKVEECEKWFRERAYYEEAVRANLLRLKIKSFLKGYENIAEDINGLIETAKLSGSDKWMGKAYYFKMEHRDMMRKWEDDVHILDSARMFSARAKDSVTLCKIRITSVLPINASREALDSTYKSLNEALRWSSPELKCVCYITLGMQYGPKSKVDSAVIFLNKGVEVANQWGSKLDKMSAYQRLLRTHLYGHNYDEMISVGNIALELAKSVENKELERIILKEIGYAWAKKGQSNKGVNYAIEAVDLAKELGNEDRIFSSQHILVDFLLKAERLDEADLIVSKMLKSNTTIEKNFANDGRHAQILLLDGRLKEAHDSIAKALVSYQYAGKLIQNHGGRRRLIVDLKIFSTMLKLDRIEEAVLKHEFMDSFYVKFKSKNYFSNFYYLEGKLMYELGNMNRTIQALNKYLKLTKIKNSDNCYSANKLISKAYSELGEYRKALEHSRMALKIKEEIIQADDALKLEKIHSKNDLKNKEVEIGQLKIDRLEQEKAIREQENKLQTRRLYVIVLSVILILLVVIALFVYNRSKQARIREELERTALEKERQIELLRSEESKRTVELKNQLFANISHEFRTPLTLIQAPVEELLNKVEEKNKKPLEVVKRNADHLLVMVDELLELAKLDSGNTPLSKKELELKKFIEKLRMNFKPIFRQKNIHFETNFPNQGITILADEYRLKMVMNNILKNAFHHATEKGTVRLNAAVNVEEGVFEMSVFNTGEWIDEEFLPTIFERYSRSKDKEYSGYGIGLSFCKQIITLHEGSIKVENIKGGVQVSFTIPSTFKEVDTDSLTEGEISIPTNALDESTGGQHKLLIVEDNLEMQDLLNDLLRNHYELLFADNGEEGIKKAEEHQPDLIVSDVMMPKIGGMELARTLKDNFSTSHIPIVLLTAKSAGHDRIAGLETGADDYLTKPFSPKELRVRVRNLIEQRERLRRRFSKNVFLLPEEITSNTLDQEFLLKATEIVESNLDNPVFSVERFCRLLALNRNSVHQKLKSLTGSSASQFIKSIKLKKAAVLLADERISIVEVSELSGFNNRPTFNKAFKEQFEMTPSEYRTKCLTEKE